MFCDGYLLYVVVLSLYDEETKIQTQPEKSVLNPATSEEMIIHFRIVNRDLTPLIGLNDSEMLQLIELLRENIALVAPGNPSVALTASQVTTPLTLETILTKYSQVFVDSSGAPARAKRARSGAPWVRKFGKLSIPENLVMK